MKRYSMYVDNHGAWHGEQTICPYDDKDGEWVRYDDAKKEIDMYRKYLITLCE